MSPKMVDEDILSGQARESDRDGSASSVATRFALPAGRASRLSVSLLLGLACVAVQWIRVRDTYFVFDDFLFTRIAQLHTYSYSLVTTPLFEHFSPMLWTMNKLMVGPLGMRHGIALFIGLAVSFWAIASLHRLVLRLSGSEIWSAILVALYGLSIVMTDILRWFTTSVHANLCAALTLACLLFFVRYRDSDRRADAVASVIFLVGALLTHEKSLLIVGYVALLWLVAYASAVSWRVVRDELDEHRWLWSVYFVLAVASAINFYKNYYLGLPGASPSAIALFVSRSFTTSFTPAFFGLRYPEVGGFLGNSVKVAVIVGFALAIVLTTRRARAAWRGWIFLFTVMVVNFAVLGQARIATYGPDSHHALQYQQEVAFLFPLGLALVIGFLRTSQSRPRHRLPTPAFAAVAILLGVVYGVVSMRSNDVVERSFDVGELSRSYLDRLDHDAHHDAVGGFAPSVLDTAVPEAWMSSAFVPYNLVGNVAAVMHIPIVPGLHRSGQPTYEVRPDGSLVPYRLASPLQLEVTTAGGSPASTAAGDGHCVETDVNGAYVSFAASQLERGAPDSTSPFVVRLSMTTSGPIGVEAFGGIGTASLLSTRADIPAGRWEVDLSLSSRDIDHVDVHVFKESTARSVCFQAVTLGSVTTE